MGKQNFEWGDIFEECRTILKKRNKSKPIKTWMELYNELKKSKDKKKQPCPASDTFKRHLSDELDLGKYDRLTKDLLYSMLHIDTQETIEDLLHNAQISVTPNLNQNCWLFITLKREDNTGTKSIVHLYQLSHKIKTVFSEDVAFISFDIDTIVVLCSSEESKAKIEKYVTRMSKQRLRDWGNVEDE